MWEVQLWLDLFHTSLQQYTLCPLCSEDPALGFVPELWLAPGSLLGCPFTVGDLHILPVPVDGVQVDPQWLLSRRYISPSSPLPASLGRGD